MMTINTVRKIIKGIKEHRQDSLFIVKYHAGILEKIPVKFSTINNKSKLIEFSISPIFLRQLETTISGNQYVSIYLETMECLFKSKVVAFDIDKQVLMITFPIDYVLKDRRGKERLLVNNSRVSFLYHHDQPYVITNKHLYDLSLGGCSLVFSASEYLRFKETEHLDHFAISFQEQVHYFSGTVVGVRKLKAFELETLPYARYRVSIAFDFLDDMQEIYLINLLEELRNLQKIKRMC